MSKASKTQTNKFHRAKKMGDPINSTEEAMQATFNSLYDDIDSIIKTLIELKGLTFGLVDIFNELCTVSDVTSIDNGSIEKWNEVMNRFERKAFYFNQKLFSEMGKHYED